MIKTIDIETAIKKTTAIDCSMPSINLSDKYTFLSTKEILNKAMDLGWNILDTEQKGKKITTQHRVSMIHDSVLKKFSKQDHDGYPVLYITNSHDGTCSLKYNIAYHNKENNFNIVSYDAYIQDNIIKRKTTTIKECVDFLDNTKAYISNFLNCIDTFKNRNLTSQESFHFLSYINNKLMKGKKIKLNSDSNNLWELSVHIHEQAYNKKILRGFNSKFVFSQKIWNIMCSCLIFNDNDLIDFLNEIEEEYSYEQ